MKFKISVRNLASGRETSVVMRTLKKHFAAALKKRIAKRKRVMP